MAGKKSFAETIMGVTHGSNQASQQEPGIEMELYQQNHCQLGLPGTEMEQHVGRLSDFLDYRASQWSDLAAKMCHPSTK